MSDLLELDFGHRPLTDALGRPKSPLRRQTEQCDLIERVRHTMCFVARYGLRPADWNSSILKADICSVLLRIDKLTRGMVTSSRSLLAG